jgi:long-chain acyl-CoA synthetase
MTAMDTAINEQAQRSAVSGDTISARQASTLWGLFCERIRRSPDTIAYRDYNSIEGGWRDYTWRTISERVDRFRAALAKEYITVGDRVAILLPNGIDWVCLDLAAHGSGLVVVGLYPHDTAASNAHILGHSDARLVFLDTEARWKSLGPFRSEFPSLERVWIRDARGGADPSAPSSIVRQLADVLAIAAEPPPQHLAAPRDLATLIYTSGTTGRPKGVMLSHYALLWNAQASAVVIPPRPDDVFLSILPMAHAFERTVGYYLPMMGGCMIAYARSADDLPKDLVTTRPTAMLGVPLLFERMSAAIWANVAASAAKRGLLRITASVGWRRFVAAQHRASPGLAARLLWPILKRNIATRVLAAFGGRLRVAISGGAPLDQGVARLLIGLGLPLVEGYGLTEAAPVVAANELDDNLPGSVGRPLDGIEVKLTPQGELLVRSPSIMMGYWKDDAETARALDSARWLSTGDVAEIHEDGRIFIRGRIKEIIVLSIGEKINPNVVEAELTRDPLFKQVMVVGNRRPYLAAVIVLNADAWKLFAADKGLDPQRPNHAAGQIEVLAIITQLLIALPRYAQVRAVYLTLEPWTIEAGLLTPTLKIKRATIAPLFAKEIDDMYAKQQELLHAGGFS